MNSDTLNISLVVTHPSFYYYFTTNDFPDLPRFAKNCTFCPILSKTKGPHSNRHNAAFYALLKRFEKGKLYDKSNVHLPRQEWGRSITIH